MEEIEVNLPGFTIETGVKSSEGPVWGKLAGRAVCISDSYSPEPYFHESENGKVCILGTPVYRGEMDFKNLSFDLLKDSNYNKESFLSEIDSEFLLIILTSEKLCVVSSRFASPPFFYCCKDGSFIGSFSFNDLWMRLHKLDRLEPNFESIFELLAYKRVFGEKTHDRNSFIMPPATLLSFDGHGIQLKRYWMPDFRDKVKMNLKDCVFEFNKRILGAIEKKTSDNKRYALFLSGGMDSRTVLSAFSQTSYMPECITINQFENREVKMAAKICRAVGAKHHYLPFFENHYRKVADAAFRLTGALQLPMFMFLGYRNVLKKFADVAFHGHGFDYFFQGMYLPAKTYKFMGQDLYYRRLLDFDESPEEFFVKNVSYRIIERDPDMLRMIKSECRQQLCGGVLDEVRKKAQEAEAIVSNKFDIVEYLTFYNLARHYPFADHWSMNTNIPQRTISFDNDLYDFYQSLPVEYRFDARLMRERLKIMHPGLAKLRSANTTYPVGASSLERTYYQLRDSFLRKLRLKSALEDDNDFQRMGLPFPYVLCGELRDYVEELLSSDHLSILSFLDMDEMRNYVKGFLENPRGNGQLMMALVAINRLLKQTE